jgi:peptidoglycan/xylan/chitin deacetylase (PgdA/CDA1 family)
MSLKSQLKRAAVSVLYWSGALWLLAAVALRRKAIVLMYHRVLPAQARADSHSADAIVVSARTFERQMEFLRRHFRPLAPGEFAAALRNGDFAARSCLVTFDDGWYDNLEHALPVLRRHGVPATIFVATDYIGGTHCFWQERLARLLWSIWRGGADGRAFARELTGTSIPEQDEARVRVAIRAFVSDVKSQSAAAVTELIARCEAHLDSKGITHLDNGNDRFMSWEEVGQLATSGVVTIGSHARTHTPLTLLPGEHALAELRESAAILRERLQQEPRFFAYPNGNHSAATEDLVARAGYQLAFTTDSGHVAAGDSPLRVRRINIAEHGTSSNAEFLARIVGLT